MRLDVERDLSASAKAFQEIVWPQYQPILGGEIRHVESVSAQGFEKDLDTLAGIDAWQIHRESGQIYGVGSRVQPVTRGIPPGALPYNTFTIRLERHNGYETEYSKRLHAIERGALYPAITIHGYYCASQRTLLSSMSCKTRELFCLAEECFALDGHQEEFEGYICPNSLTSKGWGRGKTSNADFLWFHFSFIEKHVKSDSRHLVLSDDYISRMNYWRERKAAA